MATADCSAQCFMMAARLKYRERATGYMAADHSAQSSNIASHPELTFQSLQKARASSAVIALRPEQTFRYWRP